MTGSSSSIHPSAVIGPGVSLGERVVVGPYAVLLGPLTVGDGVWIGGGTQIGAPPEISTARHNLAWTGDLDHFGVVIGDDVVIRELVVIHQGSHRPTTVGTGCLLFNRCYVAHDVHVGAATTLSAGVSIGGHCTIRAGSNLGMNVTVHQFRQIGDRVMVGMGAAVTHDLPPFSKAYGVPIRVHGTNTVGMQRAGFSDAAIDEVTTAFAAGETDVALPELADAFGWWRDLPERRPAPMG